jgi:hypothetical protein
MNDNGQTARSRHITLKVASADQQKAVGVCAHERASVCMSAPTLQLPLYMVKLRAL